MSAARSWWWCMIKIYLSSNMIEGFFWCSQSTQHSWLMSGIPRCFQFHLVSFLVFLNYELFLVEKRCSEHWLIVLIIPFFAVLWTIVSYNQVDMSFDIVLFAEIVLLIEIHSLCVFKACINSFMLPPILFGIYAWMSIGGFNVSTSKLFPMIWPNCSLRVMPGFCNAEFWFLRVV